MIKFYLDDWIQFEIFIIRTQNEKSYFWYTASLLAYSST